MNAQSTQPRIIPYRGTVNVYFSDAIIASSDRAQVLAEADGTEAIFIPFEDIYFDFLQRASTSGQRADIGTITYWDAQAVGEAQSQVLLAYETPEPAYASLRGHGTFDPDKTRIEAVPAPDQAHSTQWT
jgi:uncharacterized protein (DUF427 family)